MADPIRLYAEFTDDLGTDWRVNIHDADFGGTAAEFKLGADGFVLRYSGNNEDRYQPVIGSEMTFTLTEENSTHTTFMDLLATNVEVRFSVSVRRDPDGTDDFWWGGILLPEQVVRPFDYYPIQNTLTASDDLGNLQSIKYNNDGAAYTGEASVVEHLLNCLNKTRATHLWSTDDFLYYVNDFDSSDYTGSNQLNDTRIKHGELYNPNDNGEPEYYDTSKILSDLCRVFNARLFQSQGKWWFLPVGAQKYSQTLTVEGTQKNGTALTQQSIVADKDFDSTFQRLRGYEYTYLAPAKTVRRTRRFDGNLPVIFDPYYAENEFGTTLSDTDIDYPADSVLLVSGSYTYNREGDGGAIGDASVGRSMLELTIKCGQYYLNRIATFDDEVNTFFIGNVILNYTGHVYGEVEWTTTASTYDIVSVPFNEEVDYYGGFDFAIQTPPLPADETGLDLTVDIVGINNTGASDSSLVTSADYDIYDLRADIITGGGNGDELVFTATNDEAARFDIDQGACIFGDQDVTNSIGVIRVLQSGSYEPTTAWQSLNFTGTGVGIHRLGVQEALGGQDKATPIQRGTVYGSPIYMWQVIDDSTSNFGGDYALFEMTYTARSLENQIEAFRIDRDLTNVTTSIGDAENVRPVITGRPVAIAGRLFEELGAYVGIGRRNYGSRDQRVNREIAHRDGVSYSVGDSDLHIMNTWTGPNGFGRIELPPIAESHGRIIQFHSDSTISANTYVTLAINTGDTGVTIDGAATYNFNRAYDGITILGHTDDNWYIIQKKEK